MIALLALGLFFALLLMRASAASAMGIACLVGLLAGGYPLSQVPRYMSTGVESFVLLAVPFFILVGNLLNGVGATQRIFDFARAVFGSIPGALAQVNVGASMIFAGMSGAALADAAGLGTVEMQAMRRAGYRPAFAAAVTLASSVIGPIIPPSVVMVVYSAATGVSTGRLFLAGLVPGVLIGLVLMIYIYVLARTGREPCPATDRFSLSVLGRRALSAGPALLAPVIVLAGLVSGSVTPTEAGVAAVLYTLLVGVMYRTLTLGVLMTALRESAMTSATILYLIAVSAVFGWLITVEGTAHQLASLITLAGDSPIVGLLMLNLLLLVIGCLMETTAAILIAGSLLLPVATALGVDPVHFGVILCFNLLIGIMTPPMGVGLFVIAAVGRVPVASVIRAALPFLVPLMVALMVITFVPALSLWLPGLVFDG
ncbi:TRAP transporter large permease [Roseospira navarrensis]|uniref:TRAP transporter large permease protein n=1 Tax=Roseospira navarrensis TaxID=140058 RepID=A0A7X1ZHM7_9PROT|nr:TRAP transporter large permease [Roseospira navarrensis]MQX37801.1 TRAP transporter large permease subunit [Roseospira navarrensis]